MKLTLTNWVYKVFIDNYIFIYPTMNYQAFAIYLKDVADKIGYIL